MKVLSDDLALLDDLLHPERFDDVVGDVREPASREYSDQSSLHTLRTNCN